MSKIKPLRIGTYEFFPPVIQGGMGVRISKSGLAAAAANAGCLGTIASVGLGAFENVPGSEYIAVNNQALRSEIAATRALTDRPFAVNIMGVLTNYSEFVKICVEEKVAIIVSGAGLPLDLPGFDPEKNVRLIPIISSARALAIIVKKWRKSYDRTPDGVIIEGPLAGGHLGYSMDELEQNDPDALIKTLASVKQYCAESQLSFPVIVGGGIYNGSEAARFLRAGADGVQIATRFVCTDECDADIRFKREYLRAEEKDIALIKSPVGLPGRVVVNPFVKSVMAGERVPFRCNYKCLKTCDPAQSPYCIAKVLADAAGGNLDKAFAFAGANAWRCTEIVPVKKLVSTLLDEMNQAEPT